MGWCCESIEVRDPEDRNGPTFSGQDSGSEIEAQLSIRDLGSSVFQHLVENLRFFGEGLPISQT